MKIAHLAASAMAAVCLLSGAAHASSSASTQTSAPASKAEMDALSSELGRTFYDLGGGDEGALGSAKGAFDGMLKQTPYRPEWADLMRQAAQEEMQHDRAAIDRLLGEMVASQFTIGELRVGVELLRTPGVVDYVKAVAKSGKAPMSKDVERAFTRLMRSADGRSFLEKLNKLDPKTMNQDRFVKGFVVEIVPGMMRRFGEKAEAAEAARAAAHE